MKNIALAGILFFAMCTFTTAQTVNNKLTTWEASDKNGKIKLVVKGEVKISDDDQHITSLSKNGSIDYEQKSKKLEVTNTSCGTLIYRINNKATNVLDANDQHLLSSAIQMMIKHGINAEARAKRIFAKNGTQGVLNELPALNGDYARQQYLTVLLTQHVSTAEMTSILENSSKYLSSDYYIAKLLDDVMKTYLLEEATSSAYLNMVRNMKSDYYQYTTLQKMMKGSLNNAQTAAVVDIIKTMKSDYYQSEVYKDLLKQEEFGGAAFNETLELVFAMKSDHYKTEIVKNLTKRQLAEADWARLISYANKLGSDYYQSQLLLDIAEKMPENELLKKSLFEAAKGIKSEYYYGKLMRKIAAS